MTNELMTTTCYSDPENTHLKLPGRGTSHIRVARTKRWGVETGEVGKHNDGGKERWARVNVKTTDLFLKGIMIVYRRRYE